MAGKISKDFVSKEKANSIYKFANLQQQQI
jgi:hypothetical protein